MAASFLFPSAPMPQSNFGFYFPHSRPSGETQRSTVVVPLPIRPIISNPIFSPITPTPLLPTFKTQPSTLGLSTPSPELSNPELSLILSPSAPLTSLDSMSTVPLTILPETLESSELPGIRYDLQLAQVHLQQAKRKCFQFWSQREAHSQQLYDQLACAIREVQTGFPSSKEMDASQSQQLETSAESLQQVKKAVEGDPITIEVGEKSETHETQGKQSKSETMKEKHGSEFDASKESIPPDLAASIHESLLHYSKTRKITGRIPCRFGCGKKFSTPSGLARHQRKHTGDNKRFFCPYKNCGKGFSELSALKRHHLVHTGERPFKCPRAGCGKSFCDASNLRRHQLMHDGEKPYKCPMCIDRFFGRAGTLRNHLMAVHKISPAWLNQKGHASTQAS